MVRETGIRTSLILLAIGAVLAFAVNLNITGIDLNTVGVILMLVGLIGFVFTFAALGDLDWISGPRYRDGYHLDDTTPPHTHRRVDTTDVVYEDEHGAATTERVHRIQR